MREALVELAGNIAGSIFGISFKVFLCTVVAVKTLEWLEVIQ
jgi:hypothetical protein